MIYAARTPHVRVLDVKICHSLMLEENTSSDRYTSYSCTKYTGKQKTGAMGFENIDKLK